VIRTDPRWRVGLVCVVSAFRVNPGGFNAASVDGAVQFIQTSIDPRLLKGLVTRDGNEAATIPR
jgi:hypothetical protein